MIVLFEEFHYNLDALKDILSERYYVDVNTAYSKTTHIGYCFNPRLKEGKGDIVIILPKVFLDINDLAFGKYNPEIFLDLDDTKIIENNLYEQMQFIFELSTWLYRVIDEYDKKKKNDITDMNFRSNVISNIDSSSNSELSIILSMIDYYERNKKLITFINKRSKSQNHRIDWNRTVTKSLPFIEDDRPIYLEHHTTSKFENNEEELLVIFFSALNYLKEKYSFKIDIPKNYDLIKGNKFERMLQTGCRSLKRIRYKYFSDRMKQVYNLLYVFFERSRAVKNKSLTEEVLMVKSFHEVFESMVDDLISDDDVIHKLKNHTDGKQLDHIYKDISFFGKDEIYFIGDSKYYKAKSKIDVYSKAKQFTYAKNVIQYNVNLLNKNELGNNLKYRDQETEGYNITPNFFISAQINESLDFYSPDLKNANQPLIEFHFENRLFDRDTLILQSYKINFLFLLSSYISNNTRIKNKFKKEIRKKFRSEMLGYLDKNYDFYKITPLDESFVDTYFKTLNGKIYKPSQYDKSLILALQKKYINENNKLLNTIKPSLNHIERLNVNHQTLEV